MKNILTYILAIIIICFFSFSALAQKDKDTPLKPEKKGTKPHEIGIVVGLGTNFQSGILTTPVCECDFENGFGFGYTIGFIYEKPISNSFKFGFMAHLYNNSMETSYTEIETINSDSPFQADLQSRHEAVMEITSFAVIPFVSWWPTDYFFTRVGLSANMLISSNLRHDKIPMQTVVKTVNGDLIDVSDYATTVEDGPFPGVNELIWGLTPQIGFNIFLPGSIMMSPVIHFNIPFTEQSIEGDAFKINNFRFLLELKWRWKWMI